MEQRLRIVADVGQQLADRVRVGRREVDVAAPDPALGLLRARGGTSPPAAGRGSSATSQPPDELAGVHLVVVAPGGPLLLAEVLGRALQRVVHQLGRVEELLAAVDDLPLDVEPDVLHQRDERVEDLADAAAERGGRDVDDLAALQGRGELPDLVDQVPADDVRVVGRGAWSRLRLAEARAGIYPVGRVSGGRSPSLTRTTRCAVAGDGDRDRLAGLVAGQRERDIGRARDRRRAHLRDDVAARAEARALERDRVAGRAAQPGLRRRAAAQRRRRGSAPCVAPRSKRAASCG